MAASAGLHGLLSLREPRVFAAISDDHLTLLAGWSQEPINAIRTFLSSVLRFDERFVGKIGGGEEQQRKQAVYILAYLARSHDIARSMIGVYAPLLRSTLFDPEFRARIAATFLDDAGHLVWDLDGVEPADSHEPYDWFGNVNDLSPAGRADLLLLGDAEAADMYSTLARFFNLDDACGP